MRPLVVAALLSLSSTATAAEGFTLGARLSHGTIGAGDARLRGHGVDDYQGRRDVDVRASEQGVSRPAFTTFDLVAGGSVRFAALYVTLGGGAGKADGAPAEHPVIDGARLSMMRFGIEPRLQLPIGATIVALGASVGLRSIDAPLIGLSSQPGCRGGCGGRAKSWQPYFAPRLALDVPFAESDVARRGTSKPSTVIWYASAFAAVDVLHAVGRLPFELGLGVGALLSTGG